MASVLFKDRKFVILISDTYDQAVMFLNDIKAELQDNDQLTDLFGEMIFEKDAENDIIVKMDDGYKFRIIAKGSEQKVRGIKWDGMRPDLIIGDDLENDEIVLNKERREKFKQWFMGAVLPARNDRGIVRLVGTILHMDSLLENLMPKPWDRKYTKETGLKRYSIRPIRHSSWLSVKYRAHNPDFTEILWTEKWPKERLIAERQKYIDQGIPEGYSQEYLNEPIDESKAYFRREDFLSFTDEDKKKIKENRLRKYAAADFAVTKDDHADYSVFIVGGVDENGMLLILDVIRERMDAREIIDTMFAIQKRYDPDLFTVEKGLIEKSLGPFLKAEMFKPGNPFINLNSNMPTKDKESRARSIQARMRAGGVKFDKSADWYPHLEMEMRQFPRAVHDDQVDAMAWLGLTLNKMSEGQTVKEVEEEEYMEEYTSTMQPQGRSIYTGY